MADDVMGRVQERLVEVEREIARLQRVAQAEAISTGTLSVYAEIERKKSQRSRLMTTMAECTDTLRYVRRTLGLMMCYLDPSPWDDALKAKWEELACTQQASSRVLMIEAHSAWTRLKTVIADLERLS
jgi:hypothetical protein